MISEDSMRDLGVVLRFTEQKVDITELGVEGATLEYHSQSGHPSVKLMFEEECKKNMKK